MHSLISKKTFGGLVGLLAIIAMVLVPGNVHRVGAEGGYTNYLPGVMNSNGAMAPNTSQVTIIGSTSPWKYYAGSAAAASGWINPSFDDSTWKSGASPLGYGNGGEATVVSYGSDPNNKWVTTYFRKTFSINEPSLAASLALTMLQDDGAVVYLNGQRVHMNNMPSGTISNTTLAPTCGEDVTSTASLNPALLVKGTNVLAVEVHQCNPTSSDLNFKAQLVATLYDATPTAAPTQPPVQPTAQPTAAPTTAPTTAPQPTVAPTVKPTAAPTVPPVSGRAFYVAPNGSSGGNGSSSAPWDLVTALKHPSVVQPGDTIWVRGGTYKYRSVSYIYSYLKGSSSAPITLRAYPGERAIIDASLSVQGQYLRIWGLEFYDSNPVRTDGTSNSRNNSFAIWGPGVKLINNIIHDAGGLGFWWQSTGSEAYGNLIYNNGSMGTDRGHGHGIYTTNQTGMKQINDNIMFNSFSGVNIHAYSEKTVLNGFHFEGNVSFNGRFLVGGLVPASNVEMYNNYTYRGMTRMGYSNSVTNQNLTMVGNLLDGVNEDALQLKAWNNFNIHNNQFRSPNGKMIALDYPSSHGSYVINNDAYYSTSGSPFALNGAGQSWSSWRSTTGLDAASSLAARMPTGLQVFVRPNKYEAERGHVIVYNWDRAGSVNVDVSALSLKVGQTYVLHNAQNYFKESITFTYNGQPISVPMTGWSIAVPAFWSSALQSTTFPEFGAFIISKN